MRATRSLYFPPRTDGPDILAQLEREGVIDRAHADDMVAVARGQVAERQSGEYLFKREASLRDVMDLLVSGRQVACIRSPMPKA